MVRRPKPQAPGGKYSLLRRLRRKGCYRFASGGTLRALPRAIARGPGRGTRAFRASRSGTADRWPEIAGMKVKLLAETTTGSAPPASFSLRLAQGNLIVFVEGDGLTIS